MGSMRVFFCFLGMLALIVVLIACLMAIPRSATGRCYKNGCCETKTQSDIDCE